MATENLKVKITADASQAKAEIGKFKSSLKDTTSSANTAAGSVTKLKGALSALIALKVAKAMAENAISVAALGDEIKDQAQKVFMNTTAYQEWGYVLKQNGVEMGALKGAMRKFSQEVATGSDKLAKYGITSRDVDTAFQQAVYAIQNMGTETERVAAATELFGTRALELMPVLNLTNAETQSLMESYRLLGGTMSNELIAMSDQCTDSITAMKAAWQGLKNVLAAYVIPIITKVVQWLTIAIAYVRIFLRALFGVKETFGGSSGSSKNSIVGASVSVARSTGNTAKNLGKSVKHAKELRRTLMGIDELSKLVEQATSSSSSSGSGSSGGGGVSSPSVSGGDVGSFDNIISDETMDKIANFEKKIENIKGILNGVYDILHGLVLISLGDWAGGWDLIKQGADKVWDNLKENYPVLQDVEDKFDDLKKNWKDFKETVGEKWIEFKARVASKWNDLKTDWNNITKNVQDKMANMKAQIATKWDNIKTDWQNITKNVKGKTVKMKAKIGSKWKDLKGKWEKLLSNFKGKTAEIKLKFSAAASDLKDWINTNVMSKIRGVFEKIPIVGPKYAKYIRLAKGGILTEPTTALLGEYAGARSNPEIATPQSLMYETIQRANGDLVGAFASMTRQVISAIEDKDLSVRIGDEAIARSAQRGNAAYKGRTGKALLTI